MALHKTSGIIFHTSPYGNTSIVAKIYTQKFGLQSYIVNNVRSNKAKNKNNFFQPLSLVNLVVYHKPATGLQRISEISFSHTLHSITQNIIKTTQALFITEVLYRSIKEEEANEELFHFIQTSVLFLDDEKENYLNFHLLFMMKLTIHLGFKPDGNYSNQNNVFNLQEGVFQSSIPHHSHYIMDDVAKLFHQLITLSYEESRNITINKTLRNQMLEILLLFFSLHLPGGFKVQSHLVLREIMA
jgi:DNA repair protein RecO (recombination protein O)